MLYNIFLTRITPCVDEITGDHWCGMRYNRSTTYQVFCTCEILMKKTAVQWDHTSVIYGLQRRPITQSGEKYCETFSLNLVHL